MAAVVAPGRAGPVGRGRPERRRLLGWVLRAAASAVVLVLVARVVGGDALLAGTAVLSPGPVVAALVLGLLWRALAATRWVLVARATGAPLSWAPAYAEYLRCELLNQVLPGAVLGDLDRSRRHGQDVGLLAAARAVALERVAGHVVLVAAAGAAFVVRPDLGGVVRGADTRTVAVLVGAAVLAAVVGVLLWQPWRRRRGGPATQAWVGASSPEASGVPAALDASGRTRVVRSAAAAPVVAAVLGLSLGVLVCFVTLFVVAARATGPDTPLGQLVPTVLVVLVLAGVPLTVAGWGAREAGAALCFAAVGLLAADGVAAAVGYGLLSLVSALPGLLPLLLPRVRAGARTGALRRSSAGPGRAPRRGPDR